MRPLKRGPTPYYHQIEEILRDKISSGELRVDDRIPSEADLGKMFQVSRATVRQALNNLEHDGIICREPGRGSFVRSVGKSVTELKMTCLLEDLIALGIPAKLRVQEEKIGRPPHSAAEALGLSPNDVAYSFLRVVDIDGEPFSATRVYLPTWMGERLSKKDLAAKHLLETLSQRCGVQAEEADQIIEAIMADTKQAALLEVNAGRALLSVTRTTYNRKRQPIEHSVSLYRSDRTRFYISQKHQRRAPGGWVLAARGARETGDVANRRAVPPKARRTEKRQLKQARGSHG